MENMDKKIEEIYNDIISLRKMNFNTPEMVMYVSTPNNDSEAVTNKLTVKAILTRLYHNKLYLPGYDITLNTTKERFDFAEEYHGGALIMFKVPKDVPYLEGIIVPRLGSLSLTMVGTTNVIDWSGGLDIYPEALRPSIRNVIDSIYPHREELRNRPIIFTHYISGTGVLGHRLLVWGYEQ